MPKSTASGVTPSLTLYGPKQSVSWYSIVQKRDAAQCPDTLLYKIVGDAAQCPDTLLSKRVSDAAQYPDTIVQNSQRYSSVSWYSIVQKRDAAQCPDTLLSKTVSDAVQYPDTIVQNSQWCSSVSWYSIVQKRDAAQCPDTLLSKTVCDAAQCPDTLLSKTVGDAAQSGVQNSQWCSSVSWHSLAPNYHSNCCCSKTPSVMPARPPFCDANHSYNNTLRCQKPAPACPPKYTVVIPPSPFAWADV